MTKAELIQKVSQKSGIMSQVVSDVLEATLSTIKETVEDSNAVTLRGFGTFEAKQRAEKRGYDITARKAVNIPARKVPNFKPSSDFKIK